VKKAIGTKKMSAQKSLCRRAPSAQVLCRDGEKNGVRGHRHKIFFLHAPLGELIWPFQL
jgi:hypothetical protein